MVDALHTMRTLVRPDGTVLDIRPTPRPAWIEVRGGPVVERVGEMREATAGREYVDADRALAEAIARGWFRVDAERCFLYERDAPSVSSLQAHIDDTWSKDAFLDGMTILRAERAVARAGAHARVVLVEEIGARRLLPLGHRDTEPQRTE